MNKWTVAFILLSSSQVSLGAQALLVGFGQTLSAPDYVELTILIDSKCYPIADDARKINDEATREIVDFLNKKIKKQDNYNRVSTSGGVTSPYYTFYQDKYLCQNTFQKQNTITCRTQDIKNFEVLFNEIQNIAYKQFPNSAPAVIQSSISYVTMNTPIPGISDDLRARLEQLAIRFAFQDAQSKLKALFGSQKIQNLKMIDVSEIPPEQKPFYPNTVNMAMSARLEKSDSTAPVQFEEQNINKTLYFKFSFDDVEINSQ